MIKDLLITLGRNDYTCAGASSDKDSVFIVHKGEMYVVEAKHVGSCDYSLTSDATEEDVNKFFNDLNKYL